MIKRRLIVRLSLREYLPLLLTIALWGTIVAAIGHADTVRLLAASILLRAVMMLTRLVTSASLKARIGAPPAIRRHARRMAFNVQAAVLVANLALLALLYVGLVAIGREQVAAFLPLIAIGLPVRVLRFSDVRTDSPYAGLALASGGFVAAAAGWAAGLGFVGMGLALGLREWIAYAVIRWWPRPPHVPSRPLSDELAFAEIARNTAISARRNLTYRLAKVALTVFGPVGNFAARTGRGLNWHRRVEPYIPHRLGGFILFALVTGGSAVAVAIGSGEPVAMIAAAGLMQLFAGSTNIALMWRWLPDRNDPNLVIDEDDED